MEEVVVVEREEEEEEEEEKKQNKTKNECSISCWMPRQRISPSLRHFSLLFSTRQRIS